MTQLDKFKAFAKNSQGQIRQKSNKVVVYTRVSTKEQADNNQSLATQKKYCDDYARKNRMEVVEYFGGTYESAKTDERKEFTRMLNFVKKSKDQISSIIIYSPDRFSRSGANAIYIAKMLQQNHVTIRTVLQETDTSTSSGVFHQNMQFLFSEYENNQRREKCMAGTLEKLKRGEWPAKVPIGYDQLTVKGQQQITINAQGKLLKKAFIWKAEQQLPNMEILKKLKALGLKISKQRLTETFRNPFYCGILTHNLLEGETVEGKHEKMISQEIFLRINEIQASNNQGYTTDKSDNRLPLRNYLICASCGTHMTGYEVKKKGILYYKCNKIGCKVNKSAKHLHAQYEDLLNSFKMDERLLAPLQHQLLATFNKLHEQQAEEVKQIKTTLKSIQEKLDNLEERFVMAGEITKEQYEKFSQKLKLEKQEIEKQIPSDQIKLSNLEKYIGPSLKMAAELAPMWVSGDYHERQKLQKLVFPQGVEYDKENDHYRTPRTNAVFQLMRSLSAENRGNKKGQTSNKTDLSCLVAGTGLEPVTFGL